MSIVGLKEPDLTIQWQMVQNLDDKIASYTNGCTAPCTLKHSAMYSAMYTQAHVHEIGEGHSTQPHPPMHIG